MADEKIEPDDTEGQGVRIKLVKEGETDDTDDTGGNAVRSGRIETGENESDDTEGHAARGKA